MTTFTPELLVNLMKKLDQAGTRPERVMIQTAPNQWQILEKK